MKLQSIIFHVIITFPYQVVVCGIELCNILFLQYVSRSNLKLNHPTTNETGRTLRINKLVQNFICNGAPQSTLVKNYRFVILLQKKPAFDTRMNV